MNLDTSLYPLGQSEAETQRLQRQGDLWRPLTEQLFKQAGISPGMNVLDLGCGAGDVSLLLAELVGSQGKVLGVDRDPHLLEKARRRMEDGGREHVSFQSQNLPHLTLSGAFDAIVGRAILLYVKERLTLLRHIKRLLVPGGVVIFQEPDTRLSELIMSHKQAPQLFHRCLLWAHTLFEYTGNDAQISLCLPSLFEEAGFPAPEMQIIGKVASPSETCIYEWMADFIGSQHDLLIRFGIATREEIAIETLAERLQSEAISAGSPVVSNLLIGAWSRNPHPKGI